MISAINFINKANEWLELESNARKLIDLRKFNILIGENNSGKSRMLRFIFENTRAIEIIPEEFKYSLYFKPLESIIATIASNSDHLLKSTITRSFAEEIFNVIKKIRSNPSDTINYYSLIDLIETIVLNNTSPRMNQQAYQHLVQIKNSLDTKSNELKALVSKINRDYKFKAIYIPVLRGLRPIQRDSGKFTNYDNYSERTKNDYFGSDFDSGIIYSGITIYEDVIKYLLGNEEERSLITDFENFLRDNIFHDKVTLIPKYKDDVLHVKLGSDKQFEIYNLGDGLQAIITILFPLFLYKDNNLLVFIEEPELHLHPKWQRHLLSALSKLKNCQYFISTHSSSFINIDDANILKVSKVNEKTLVVPANLNHDKVKILNELGYTPSDLFQCNFILWVEGQSDKIYLNHILKLMAPYLVEGLHYSIMFFGGSNYRYLLFQNSDIDFKLISGINQKFGIVMDSDRKRQSDKFNAHKQRIIASFEENDYFAWLTKRREIENYIPFELFVKAVKEVSNIKEIILEGGNFEDRSKFLDRKVTSSLKQNIRLSDNFFSMIQKSKGNLNVIHCNQIRSELRTAINGPNRNYISIDKIKVANKICEENFEFDGLEANRAIKKLISKIMEANNLVL